MARHGLMGARGGQSSEEMAFAEISWISGSEHLQVEEGISREGTAGAKVLRWEGAGCPRPHRGQWPGL